MNSIFRQHQLLRCQTIQQCLILDADVHKEGKPHADKGEDVGKQVFIADVLFTDNPYEGVILLIVHSIIISTNYINTHTHMHTNIHTVHTVYINTNRQKTHTYIEPTLSLAV